MRITWFLLLVALIAIVMSIPMIDRQFSSARISGQNSGQDSPLLPQPQQHQRQLVREHLVISKPRARRANRRRGS